VSGPANNEYAVAMSHFMNNLTRIKPPESDPVAWELNTGLWHLAQAIERDMAEIKKRLEAIGSDVTGVR